MTKFTQGRIGRNWLRCATIALLAGTAACQQSQTASTAPAAAQSSNTASATPAAPSGGKPAGPAAPTAPKPANNAPAAPIDIPVPQTRIAEAKDTAEAPDADRRVRIVNDSGQVVTIIKGSPSNVSEWGDDRIPRGVLTAGDSVVVDFDDDNGECVYDLQATLADGTFRVARAVNVCRISDWTVPAEE